MSNLIERQTALDKLNELKEAELVNAGGKPSKSYWALQAAYLTASVLPPAQPDATDINVATKWIPCSERLPEKDTHFYLTTIANYGLNFTTTLPDDVDVVRWDYDRRKGHNSWHWCTERTVIAWMPLPEPYAERREE